MRAYMPNWIAECNPKLQGAESPGPAGAFGVCKGRVLRQNSVSFSQKGIES